MQTTFTVSDSIFGTSQDEAAVQAVQAFLGGETPCLVHYSDHVSSSALKGSSSKLAWQRERNTAALQGFTLCELDGSFTCS